MRIQVEVGCVSNSRGRLRTPSALIGVVIAQRRVGLVGEGLVPSRPRSGRTPVACGQRCHHVPRHPVPDTIGLRTRGRLRDGQVRPEPGREGTRPSPTERDGRSVDGTTRSHKRRSVDGATRSHGRRSVDGTTRGHGRRSAAGTTRWHTAAKRRRNRKRRQS
jgi:hypothetical protein